MIRLYPITSQTSDQHWQPELDDVVRVAAIMIREFRVRAQALATAEATVGRRPVIRAQLPSRTFSTYWPCLMTCRGTSCPSTSLRAAHRHQYSKSAHRFLSVRRQLLYTRRSTSLSPTTCTSTEMMTWRPIHLRPKGAAMDSPPASVHCHLPHRSPPRNVPTSTAAKTTKPRSLLFLRGSSLVFHIGSGGC